LHAAHGDDIVVVVVPENTLLMMFLWRENEIDASDGSGFVNLKSVVATRSDIVVVHCTVYTHDAIFSVTNFHCHHQNHTIFKFYFPFLNFVLFTLIKYFWNFFCLF
jgi:hypothetical protein